MTEPIDLPAHPRILVIALRRLGDVLTRLTSDVAAVESFMVGQLAGGVGAALKLVFFVGALFWLQWELALASMVVVPVFWCVSRRFADFTRATVEIAGELFGGGGPIQRIVADAWAEVGLSIEPGGCTSAHAPNRRPCERTAAVAGTPKWARRGIAR